MDLSCDAGGWMSDLWHCVGVTMYRPYAHWWRANESIEKLQFVLNTFAPVALIILLLVPSHFRNLLVE